MASGSFQNRVRLHGATQLDQGAVLDLTNSLLAYMNVASDLLQRLPLAARIGREAEGEIWHLESGFPLLVTAEKGLAEPHVPVVTRVMKAMRASLPHISLEALGLQDLQPQGRIRRLRYVASPSRPKITMMQQPFPDNIPELVAHLQQRGVL